MQEKLHGLPEALYLSLYQGCDCILRTESQESQAFLEVGSQISELGHRANKTLGRALDLRANSAWLCKLTE